MTTRARKAATAAENGMPEAALAAVLTFAGVVSYRRVKTRRTGSSV